MNEQYIKQQIRRSLDTVLSDLPDDPRLAQRVLANAKQAAPVKRKLSVVLVVTVALMLLAAGAVAAVIHWDVMGFLFGGDRPQASFLVKDVAAKTSDGQVVLEINSALCDGELLALDWTVRNTMPDQPVYLQIDDYTANGIRLWSDGTDSFDCQWLPGWCNDGEMQGGESIALPDGITGDTVDVAMTVGVYRPKAPVCLMEAYDESEAAQRITEGFYVIAEGDGFVLPDPETGGLMHCFGRIPQEERDSYHRTELTVSFTLNLRAARSASRELAVEPSYEIAGLTARYIRARLTPAALYMTLEVTGGSTEQYDALILDGRFTLTDGEGRELEHPWDEMKGGREELEDGTTVLRSSHQWVGISAEALPDKLSLTWISDDGSTRYVMPVEAPVQTVRRSQQSRRTRCFPSYRGAM